MGAQAIAALSAETAKSSVEGRVAQVRAVPGTDGPQLGGIAAKHVVEAVCNADAVARFGAVLVPLGAVLGVRPVPRVGSVANAGPKLLAILASGIPVVGRPQARLPAAVLAPPKAVHPAGAAVLSGVAATY